VVAVTAVTAAKRAAPLLLGVALWPGTGRTEEAAAPAVAEVTDLRGRVEWRAGQGEPWQPVALEQGLRVRDGLRTGGRSTVELRFVDGTLLALGEHTRLQITLALFDVGRSPPEIRVALAAGRLDARVRTSPLTVGEGDEAVRVEPGEAARLELAGGRLVVTALPEARVFAAELSHPEVGPWGPGAPVAPAPRLLGEGRAAPGTPTSVPPWALGPVEAAATRKPAPRLGLEPDPKPGPGPGPEPEPSATGVRVRVRPRGDTP